MYFSLPQCLPFLCSMPSLLLNSRTLLWFPSLDSIVFYKVELFSFLKVSMKTWFHCWCQHYYKQNFSLSSLVCGSLHALLLSLHYCSPGLYWEISLLICTKYTVLFLFIFNSLSRERVMGYEQCRKWEWKFRVVKYARVPKRENEVRSCYCSSFSPFCLVWIFEQIMPILIIFTLDLSGTL